MGVARGSVRVEERTALSMEDGPGVAGPVILPLLHQRHHRLVSLLEERLEHLEQVFRRQREFGLKVVRFISHMTM